MDTFPDEIWMSIFSEACIDDGTTGRWLELVSKDFQRLSKPFKYQSICLRRAKQIITFDSIVKRLPPGFNDVQYLHITWPNPFLDVSDDESDDVYLDSTDDETAWTDVDSDDDGATPSSSESDGEEGFDTTSNGSSDSEGDEYEPLTLEEEQEMIADAEFVMDRGDLDTPVEIMAGCFYSYPAELARGNQDIQKAIHGILAAIASSLRILSIHSANGQDPMSIAELIPFPLPVLSGLFLCSLSGCPSKCMPPRIFPRSRHTPSLAPQFSQLQFPSLTQAHIAGFVWPEPPYIVINTISPQLRHLRLQRNHLNWRAPSSWENRPKRSSLFLYVDSPTRTPAAREAVDIWKNARELEDHSTFASLIGMESPEDYLPERWERRWCTQTRGRLDVSEWFAGDNRFDVDLETGARKTS